MSSPKAAPRAPAPDRAASLATLLCPARAEASRRNGAKSRGPNTTEGKARSARNALRHGLRAERYVVLPDEDEAAFKALEAGLMAELAPQGALQMVLARRVVAATWRLERAERLECELFDWHGAPMFGHGGPVVALLRDCNGARAFDTLLRYRGATLAELWRALRTLKALQAEAGAAADQDAPAQDAHAQGARPDEPEAPTDPGGSCQAGRASGVPDQAAAPAEVMPARGAAVGLAAADRADAAVPRIGVSRAAERTRDPQEPSRTGRLDDRTARRSAARPR